MSFYTTRHRSFVPGPHRVVVWKPRAARDGPAADAALLRAAGLAFPNARLAFVSASAYGAAVQACLAEGTPVDWSAIEPARSLRAWFARARALADAFEAELVLLASVTASGLLAWNTLRAAGDPPALAVVYGQGGERVLRALLRWARVPALDVGVGLDGAPAFTPESLAPELQRMAQAASRSAMTDAASNGRGA